jgi:plastocyanin
MARKLFHSLGAAAFVSLCLLASQAHAVHFFEGCGAGNLTSAPTDSAALVDVGPGANFIDSVTGTNVTVVRAGGKVTWIWDPSPYCHSVTSGMFAGTSGGTASQPQLVEWVLDPSANTLKNTHSVTFPTPGVFRYRCVHHEAIGMAGFVIVTP